MNILYITSLSGKRVNGFMRSAIVAAGEGGHRFFMACNSSDADKEGYAEDCRNYGIELKNIPFNRNPLSKDNRRAYRELLSYMRNNEFDVIHCNTPVGGLVGRLCAFRLKKPNVIYQAHGFHFWKGAPLKNWLLYYPVEKALAHFTDVLITINEEDYALAKRKLHAKEVIYIPGIGVDTEMYCNVKGHGEELGIESVRSSLGCGEDGQILVSVGELISRKNHAAVIRALAELKEEGVISPCADGRNEGSIPVIYCIAGTGEKEGDLQGLIDSLGIGDIVTLLGFRSDVPLLLRASDAFVFPSLQEGLPGALMEAMASEKPVVCSAIRGNVDLINDGEGGYLFDPSDISDVKSALVKMFNSDSASRLKMGQHNKVAISKYSFPVVVDELKALYNRFA